VPWPSGPQDNMLALDSAMPREELRGVVHKALLRYHPDKFIARFGRCIPLDLKRPGSTLLAALADITRAVQELKREFCVDSGGGVGDRELAPEPPASPPECIICYETIYHNLLRTTCCHQRICADCYAGDLQRTDRSRCPYCRREDYECKRIDNVMQAVRDRSRSPHRNGAQAGG